MNEESIIGGRTFIIERPICQRLQPVGCLTGGHERMFKSHIVEQPLNRSALRIGATQLDIPIAMGMRLGVAHDYLAKRPLPCLRIPAPFPDEAGNEQVFEVGGRHTLRLANVGG